MRAQSNFDSKRNFALRRRFPALHHALAIVMMLGAPTIVLAQDPPPPPPAPAPSDAVITPPKLIERVEATYPPAALEVRVEGTVGLRLTISKIGEVTKVEVVDLAGNGFDEAAMEAAVKFRFEPARKGSTPIASRILYRYEFKLPPPPPPPASPDGTPPPPPPPPPPGPPPPPPPPPKPLVIVPKGVTGPVDQDEPVDILAPIEVNVQGDQSEPRKLRESAEAVKVIDTLQAKQQSRDLGQVLGSVEGVAVRRSGGLGSYTRFSLNGLYDNQIRFFMDGVPLDIAGFPEGIANVPVNLVDRIEIYRGVLPVRFGADALGGAVNVVPQKLTDSNAYISFQRSTYGTYRAAATVGYHHKPSGFVVGGAGWFDDTRNDYLIDVEVSDKSGKVLPAVIRRFHDRYRSYGGTLQVGFVGKPWAERLSLQLFGLSYDKEVQHDAIMKRAIGDATYGATTMGATLRYEQAIKPNLHVSAVASIGRRTIRFVDMGEWVYDWLGNQIRKRNVKGELFREPHDVTIWQDSIFGRPSVEWRIKPDHVLRVSTTARFTGRTGTDKGTKTQGDKDPLAGARNIFTLMSGVEYEFNAFRMPDAKKNTKYDPAADNRFQNLVVLKHYFYDAEAQGVPVGLTVQDLDASGYRFGIGDSLRFRFTKNITAKASYELATRIPSVDEFFGDSLYVIPNLLVRPEYSHNVNAGLSVETRRTKIGNFTIEGDWFLRNISNLIVGLAESLGTIQYQNVEGAKIWGIEGGGKWISPGNWLVLEGNATWQSARNVSTKGAFQEFDGQRIPNRPWLFANWSARFQWRKLLTTDDGISPFYSGRYVHEFFRNWESVGDKDFKLVVPTQMAHVMGITYFNNVPARTSVTFEIDNVTNANLYDFFGVQKPGRVYSVKVTGEL